MFEEPKGLVEEDAGVVTDLLTKFGLNQPSSICILPSNLLSAEKQEDLFFAVSAPDIKVRLRQAGVMPDLIIPEGMRIPYRDDRDSTLILPVLLFVVTNLSGNATLINLALGVVANYVTDYFRGKGGSNRVKCCVYVKKTEKETVRRIHYDGDPNQFGQLTEAIEKALK